MGKKRITTTEEAAKTGETAPASATPKKSSKRQVINAVAHISVSYNNTLVTMTDSKGEVLGWSSSGKLGFKGTKKSTPYAANLVAKDCIEKCAKYNIVNVKIMVKGVGPGRESAMRGIGASGLNVTSIMDVTPIAHNGVRRKKPRRI